MLLAFHQVSIAALGRRAVIQLTCYSGLKLKWNGCPILAVQITFSAIYELRISCA